MHFNHTVAYLVEIMQYSGAACVSDAWHVNPLMVEIFNGHLLFKLTQWTRTTDVRLLFIEAHSTPATIHLHNNENILHTHLIQVLPTKL